MEQQATTATLSHLEQLRDGWSRLRVAAWTLVIAGLAITIAGNPLIGAIVTAVGGTTVLVMSITLLSRLAES